MKELSHSKKMMVNLLSSLVVFLSNMAINFFLSPFIVKNIGVEANGFVQLANNFVSYATLIVSIINSMAGRFITIEIHKGNVKKANTYYTSVFFANLTLLALFFIPSVLLIWNLESIIDIPQYLCADVKLLFVFIFMNFLVGLAVPMWSTSTFITNNLYLTSLGTMLSSILRVISIAGMFAFFEPKVWYVGFTGVLLLLFSVIWNFFVKRKLTPELRIKKKSFEIKSVFELITAGVWNSISSLGVILLSGLDLLICNVFIGSIEMGILSLSKTIPNIISNLSTTICNIFAPELTINYAKGNSDRLRKDLRNAMDITGILITIPLAVFFVFGDSFFELWVPTQNAKLLQSLSALAIIGYIFTSGTQVLYNVFVTVNKVRINSIMLILSGAVSTILVFICLNTTNLGIYAVAGVSSFVNLIRNMCFTVPITAKYLNFKWYTFFPQVIKSILSVVCMLFVGYLIKWFILPYSWISLIVVCGVTAILGFIINIFVVLNSEERNKLLGMIYRKLNRR